MQISLTLLWADRYANSFTSRIALKYVVFPWPIDTCYILSTQHCFGGWIWASLEALRHTCIMSSGHAIHYECTRYAQLIYIWQICILFLLLSSLAQDALLVCNSHLKLVVEIACSLDNKKPVSFIRVNKLIGVQLHQLGWTHSNRLRLYSGSSCDVFAKKTQTRALF